MGWPGAASTLHSLLCPGPDLACTCLQIALFQSFHFRPPCPGSLLARAHLIALVKVCLGRLKMEHDPQLIYDYAPLL